MSQFLNKIKILTLSLNLGETFITNYISNIIFSNNDIYHIAHDLNYKCDIIIEFYLSLIKNSDTINEYLTKLLDHMNSIINWEQDSSIFFYLERENLVDLTTSVIDYLHDTPFKYFKSSEFINNVLEKLSFEDRSKHFENLLRENNKLGYYDANLALLLNSLEYTNYNHLMFAYANSAHFIELIRDRLDKSNKTLDTQKYELVKNRLPENFIAIL